MLERLKNEPVVVAEFAKIAVALAVVFGFELDIETATFVVGAIYTVGTIVARHFVTPTGKRRNV